MAKNKTTETSNSVSAYLKGIGDEQRRKDCTEITAIMEEESGFKPKMWGTAIVGFGSYHYKYDSGHEGDSCLVGFANRANAITLYIYGGEEKTGLLEKLGKHKTSKSCIYIQKLADVDVSVLRKMVKNSVKTMLKKYPAAKQA
jgi:hypothetical protein